MCHSSISFFYGIVVKIYIYAYIHDVLNLSIEGEMADENF